MNISKQQLELLGASLAENTYPGYPDREQRLHMAVGELATLTALPSGPWETTHDEFPTGLEQKQLRQRGYRLEHNGRPLHPWFDDMVTDRAVGVVTGRGFYYHWGPNYTADAVVLHEDNVLLIQRGDTGLWALPGGFVDDGESADTAARREVYEEAAVTLTEADLVRESYRGPVVDLRVTAHAWPETTSFVYRPAERQEPVADATETQSARWWQLDAIGKEVILFGAHQFLLQTALDQERLSA